MESCLLDLAKNEVQSLVNLMTNEAQYLCCFNSYVENFEQKKKILAAKHKDVKRKFQKGKGVYSFKFEAQEWEHDADDIIHVDTKIKKRLIFNWCPNCWWQYRRGKELAKKTQHIESLLERCNSNIVAGRANVLDIKYLSLEGFIHFESRESKFQDLLKAFQDENCNMIGLQGLGGTGKTSMAKEVAHKLKESKLIDKFIFLIVSQPPDFKKIRGELAKSLYLDLEEVKEEEHSSTILSRITNMDGKLLIILDDVWVKFDLTEKLGIPFGHQHRGCNLLITSRSSLVCAEMGCQMIQLHTLTNEEALNLFEVHASLNTSYRGFKGMPQKIVKHCGGVPVAIVAVARSLKNQPISVWRNALKTLQDRGLDQNLEEVYKCLKLSYDNLKTQKAKELLLISSLFSEDSEIPIELLIKIGIGLGSFNENDKHHLIRSEVHGAIMELIYSSLLLNGEEECVKLHDLVREVALWIGENDIQSLLDLEKPIKGNLRYLVWKCDKFHYEFDGEKLEFLLILLDDSKGLNVTDTFFKQMISLKVLLLANEESVPALSLTNSLQPLKFIQTLFLKNLELGDIFALGSLSSLITLWFHTCSIIELPKEFLKLKKLRSLVVEKCKIEKNNPFEVIELCSKLEELTFVSNECDNEEKDAISQNVYPLRLHRYCISSEDVLSDCFENCGSMSRYFRVDKLSHLVSDSTYKQLVGRAEVLLLEGEDVQRIWKNVVPDIIPIEKEGAMDDLIVLYLSSRPDMECLICTKNHDPDVPVFCNLAELHLSKMCVEDLCLGPLPSGFLEQLEILKLTECHKLKSVLFNGNYNLCHLKSMQLEDCPELVSIFQPYTARSLKQLEELTITNCNALEYIIVGEIGDSNQKSYYDSLFPSLKEMRLSGVPSFISIVREYHQLISSSMYNPSPPLSRHNSSNLNRSLATRAFSWVQACCSLNKLRSASKEINSTISEYKSLDHTNPQIVYSDEGHQNSKTTKLFDSSIDRGAPSLATRRLLVQSMKNVREIELVECGNIISLSTLFIATSTIALKTLTIRRCHKLKCITTYNEDTHIDKNYYSIFPTLEELIIDQCDELEILFVSSISVGVEKLKLFAIQRMRKLKYVVENCQKEQHTSNQNQNDELHFNLPALETLHIRDTPIMNDICSKNYKLVLSSLENSVTMWNCGIKSFTDNNIVNLRTTQMLDASTDRVLLLQSVKNVRRIKLVECGNIISLSTLSIAVSTIALETLTITRCHKLKCITTHEEDAHVDKNYYSIFPTLENLIIEDSDELEILFVSTISIGLEKLKSLTIQKVPKLKYVVGNYQKEPYPSNQNQIDEIGFNLPALETLNIQNAPMMNIIFAKVIEMCWKTLYSLQVCDFKVEEIFDLSYMKTKGKGGELQPLTLSLRVLQLQNLSELMNICVGPKCIICFDSLRDLTIEGCKNLRVIFSASIVRRLPMLQRLRISRCEKLVHIVEEDYETNADGHLPHQPCFPNLQDVIVSNCEKLKYLFSITIYDIFLELRILKISEANELEHVLIKRDEMEEMLMKNVLPQLRSVELRNLPNLVSVCHGINFQKDYSTEVYNCPKFDTSTTQHQGDPEIENSQVKEKAKERLSSHMGEETQQSLTKVFEARTKGVSSNILYQISPTSEKDVPIPTSDNTHSFAKIFEEEKEEKGDPFAPSVTSILNKQTSQAILPPSPISSKASTSLNRATSSILLKASDGVDHGDIKEEGMDQNEYKSNVELSSLTRREKESSYSKGQIQTKYQLIDSQPRSAMPTTPSITISQDEYSEIVEIRGEESGLVPETPHPSSSTSKEESIHIGLNSTSLSKSPSIIVKMFEEEEEEKVPVISSEQQASDTTVPLSFVPPKALMSPKQISMFTSSQSTYSGRNVQENIGTINNQPLHESLGAIQISSQLVEYGLSEMASSICDTKNASSVAKVKEIVNMMKLEGDEPSILAEAFKAKPQLCLSSEDRSTELLCYSYRALLNILNVLATRSPFTITEVEKILLAKNLKDASVLGFDKDWLESIRVKVFNYDATDLHHKQQVLKRLGNKLEANKRELANVHNQEAKATQSVEMSQKELEATHKKLEVAYKGLEAAQSRLHVVQQEYANIRVRHSQLLEECQEILEQRDQCSEIIATKLEPFGF